MTEDEWKQWIKGQKATFNDYRHDGELHRCTIQEYSGYDALTQSHMVKILLTYKRPPYRELIRVPWSSLSYVGNTAPPNKRFPLRSAWWVPQGMTRAVNVYIREWLADSAECMVMTPASRVDAYNRIAFAKYAERTLTLPYSDLYESRALANATVKWHDNSPKK